MNDPIAALVSRDGYRSDLVVSAADLLDHPSRNRVYVDVRLGEPADDYLDFCKCHIHDAVHAQIRDVFASTPTASTGNLPLPDVAELERRLADWGVDNETELIVYGRSPAIAARGWWTLAWAGLEHVRLLDGGLRAWKEAGGPVAEGEQRRLARNSAPLVLRGGRLPDVSTKQIGDLGGSVVLVDARDEGAYELGHIPGAINLPAADQWNPRTLLRTANEITDIYTGAGIDADSEVVVYCGGGVLSALEVLTLKSVGIEAQLYVGSWSEWVRDPERRALSVVDKPLGEGTRI